MRLREIPPDVYARDVLPLTAPLWAGRRSLADYIAQTLEMARSSYGRRHYHTVGLYDRTALVSSFKRYDRAIRMQSQLLRAVGFGAVFTAEDYRGRGYASVMLATALDAARDDGYAVAFLFSDIRPQFYAELGFRTLPSRRFLLHADALPSMRLDLAQLDDRAMPAVRRVFEAWQRDESKSFARNAAVWSWIALRMRQSAQHSTGQPANFVVRQRGRIAAYVLGTRAPKLDAYMLDEFAYADEASAEAIPALLRAAAGDLRRVTGWLPPGRARDVMPRLAVRARNSAVLMMMPLNAEGGRLLRTIAAAGRDFCWGTEHV